MLAHLPAGRGVGAGVAVGPGVGVARGTMPKLTVMSQGPEAGGAAFSLLLLCPGVVLYPDISLRFSEYDGSLVRLVKEYSPDVLVVVALIKAAGAVISTVAPL